MTQEQEKVNIILEPNPNYESDGNNFIVKIAGSLVGEDDAEDFLQVFSDIGGVFNSAFWGATNSVKGAVEDTLSNSLKTKGYAVAISVSLNTMNSLASGDEVDREAILSAVTQAAVVAAVGVVAAPIAAGALGGGLIAVVTAEVAVGLFGDDLVDLVFGNDGQSGSEVLDVWFNDKISDLSGELITLDENLDGIDTMDLLNAAKSGINSLVEDATTVGSFFQSYLNSMLASESATESRGRVDPLTLDLDGDGVELIDVDESTAFFDLDVEAELDADGNPTGNYVSDGLREQVGWVGANEGLLSLDKNGNGEIDNIIELFGKADKSGTEELREYDLGSQVTDEDGNLVTVGAGDGVINSNDEVYDQLKVWQDLNQDGISQSEEMKSLSEHGITSISLGDLEEINQEVNGNLVQSKGSFTKEVETTDADGNVVTSEVTRDYLNLDLAVNQTNSVSYTYTDPDGNEVGAYDLNLDALSLPFVRGYGNVDALPIAASKNSDFIAALQDLADIEGSGKANIYNEISAAVEDIIFKWTGTQDVTGMRGLFDGQKMAAMEAFRAEDYSNSVGSSDVTNMAQFNSINNAWESLVTDVKIKLMVQSTFKDLFSTSEVVQTTETVENEDGTTSEVVSETVEITSPSYDFSTDNIDFKGITAAEIFANINEKLSNIANDDASATDEAVADELNSIYTAVDKAAFIQSVKEILNSIINQQANDAQLSLIPDLTAALVNSEFAAIDGAHLSGIYAGDDRSVNVQDGTSGDATLDSQNSIIFGNGGDEKLVGSRGDDIYVFNKGDGKDVISEIGTVTSSTNTEDYGNDRIVMGSDINKDDIYLSRVNDDYVIKFKSSPGDQITIPYQTKAFNQIEKIQFSNGEEIDLTDPNLEFSYLGSESDDHLEGSAGNDVIDGGAGDDRIISLAGDDVITGGTGDDYIQGSAGNDTFIFNQGDGKDTIEESYTVNPEGDLGNDTIQFGSGITEADLSYFISGNDLIINFKNYPDDQIKIIGQFGELSNQIENLKFTNQKIEDGIPVVDESGEPVMEEVIVDLVNKDWSAETFETKGSDGDDTIHSSAANNYQDIIDAGAGDDIVRSYGGDDVVKGGSGDDDIEAGAGNDIIEGGLGNDSLNGGSGSDTYIYNIGDGQDIIRNLYDSSDIISFGAGIEQQDISTSFSGDDLVINFSGRPEDQITIIDYTSNKGINSLEFTIQNSDGTTSIQSVAMDDLITVSYEGTSGTDNVTGTNYSDIINTYEGDDNINAGAGNDVINAGQGDDTMGQAGVSSFANQGDDTYIYNVGDGSDMIIESGSDIDDGNDIIEFGAGISLANVVLVKENNDLIIQFSGSDTDQIRIQNQLNKSHHKIETIKFSNGSTFDLTALDPNNIPEIQYEVYGTDGDDVIDTSDGNYIIDAGKGDDSIGHNTNNMGDDTYIYNKGDGNDTIVQTYLGSWGHNTSFGTDTVEFGADIDPSNVYTTKDGNDLIIKFRDSDTDQITVKDHFRTLSHQIEMLKFIQDGSTIDLTTDLVNEVQGTDSDDVIGTGTYTTFSDHIITGQGNDTIDSGAGNDIIDAGKGNDIIGKNTNNDGDDTYIFNIGDGQDIIRETYLGSNGNSIPLGNDTIQFGEGITRDDIYFSSGSGSDLVIKFHNSDDQITVTNQFGALSNRIENVKFDDGTILDISSASAVDFEFNGTAGGDSVNFAYGGNSANISTGDGDDNIVTKTEDNNVDSGSGDDVIESGHSGNSASGTSVVDAGAGNDRINSYSADNIIDAGTGDDIISSTGNSIYLYSKGDGNDVITDYSGNDIIKLDESINKDDVYISKVREVVGSVVKNNLVIKFKNSDQDSITIVNHLDGSNKLIETLEFSDRETIDLTDLANLKYEYYGTDGDDVVDVNNYTDYADYVQTGDGNDTIDTNGGNDVINAGKGDDIIGKNSDNYGDDTYIFNVGDGKDTISETYAGSWGGNYSLGTDMIEFGEGISQDSIYFTKDGNDLVIRFKNTDADQITVKDHFRGLSHKIEILKFNQDASTFDLTTLDPSTIGDNTIPLTTDDSFSTAGQVSTIISLADILANDFDVEDGDSIRDISINDVVFSTPANGTIVVNADNNTITYTQNSGYVGTEEITYQIADSEGALSNISTISVDVTQVAASLVDDNFELNEDNSITISLSDIIANDSGVNAVSINELVFANPANGTIAIDSGNNAIIYIPTENYNGNDSISYQVNNGDGTLSDSASINLNVISVNDAPSVINIIPSQEAKEGETFIYALPNNIFSDVDVNRGETDSLIIAATLADGGPLPQWLSFSNNIFSGTPTDSSSGELSIKITATDSFGESVSENLIINIEDNAPADQYLYGDNEDNILIGADGNDTIIGYGGDDILSGNEGSDLIKGGGGNDQIWGGSDNDVLKGGYGEDYISGGNGDDYISGNQGNDIIGGGSGNDILKGGKGNDKIWGGDGDDLVVGNSGDDLLTGNSGNDLMYGGSGNDDMRGGTGNDVMYGGSGNDKVNGKDGDDILFGGSGNDFVKGDQGDDIMKGDSGNDLLIGGLGSDTMSGGKGNDLFIFNSLEESSINSSDLITDFTKGNDKIDFSNLGFASVINAEDSSDQDVLSYHFEDGNTIIEDHDQSFSLTLNGEINLDNSDFNFG